MCILKLCLLGILFVISSSWKPGHAMSLGQAIRRLRKERGMTLADLAERCDSHVGNLSRIERDQARPSLELLYRLAQALSLSLTDIFSVAEKKQLDSEQVALNSFRCWSRIGSCCWSLRNCFSAGLLILLARCMLTGTLCRPITTAPMQLKVMRSNPQADWVTTITVSSCPSTLPPAAPATSVCPWATSAIDPRTQQWSAPCR